MARKILQSKKDLWSGFTKQSNRTFGSFLKVLSFGKTQSVMRSISKGI